MKNLFKIKVLIIIFSISLISQTKQKLILEDLFPKEYISADRELCNIILEHVNQQINLHLDTIDKAEIDLNNIFSNSRKIIQNGFSVTLSRESNGFDAQKSDLILHELFKKNKNFKFESNENTISLNWEFNITNYKTVISFVYKKEFLNSFRKSTYDKKRDLVVALIAMQDNFIKDSVTQTKNIIDWESLSLINTSKKLKKIKENIYSLNIDSYNNFHNSFYLGKFEDRIILCDFDLDNLGFNLDSIKKNLFNPVKKQNDKKPQDPELINKSNLSLDSIQREILSSLKSSLKKPKNNKIGDFELIYNSNLPLESISNILLSSNWFYKDTIEVNLKHKLYGHEEFTHKINLVALNKFLIEEHDPFIAVIDSAKNGDYYKVNEIFVSKNKKNVHLIKYEIPKNNFFNKDKVLLNATLYSNIRLDNLADIDKQDVKKTPKIKLKL